MRADVSRYVEGTNLAGIAEQVDKARAEALKAHPKAAEDLGLSAEDVAAAKKAEGEVAEAEPVRHARARPDPIDGEPVQGLDPEVAKALEHPQVRQAIQEELTKAETAQRSYGEAINTAFTYAQAGVVDHFPELANLPIEHWEGAL